jgi:quercetin dioxygenase-like cupin family protein
LYSCVGDGKRPFLPQKRLRWLQLVAYAEQGIASRVLTKTSGGNVTLFAFDVGQGLSEHTAPLDALVFVLESREKRSSRRPTFLP